MQNLIVLSDVMHTFPSCKLSSLELQTVDLAVDMSRESVLLLTPSGQIERCSTDLFNNASFLLLECILDPIEIGWFNIEYIDEISSIVCISKMGSICRVGDGFCEQEGVIDGGINAAQWSPDYQCLVLSTNSGSLLAMTSTWDVLNEVSHSLIYLNYILFFVIDNMFD